MSKEKPTWYSKKYEAQFVDSNGLRVTLGICAYKPTKAYKQAQEWVFEFNRLKGKDEREQKAGRLIKKRRPYQSFTLAKFPQILSSTYIALEGYKSNKGWAIIRGGAAHEDFPAIPSKKIKARQSTNHSFSLQAEIDDLLVEGGYDLLQSTSTGSSKVGERADNGVFICTPAQIIPVSGESVPGVFSLRQLVQTIFNGAAQRTEQEMMATARGTSHNSKNVLLFGKGTEQMKALCVGMQKLYDRFSSKELSELPTAEETETLLASFLEKAKSLHGELIKITNDRPEVFLISTPLQTVKDKLELAEKAKRHWFTLGEISTRRATAVNEVLQKKQNTLSLNVLKSLFKNYIDWAGAVPGSPEDLLSLLGGKAGELPWSLPRSLSGWKESAEKDASILNKQANAVKKLTELREFYLKRAEQAVKELKKLEKAHKQLKGLYDQEMKFSNALYSFYALKRK